MGRATGPARAELLPAESYVTGMRINLSEFNEIPEFFPGSFSYRARGGCPCPGAAGVVC